MLRAPRASWFTFVLSDYISMKKACDQLFLTCNANAANLKTFPLSTSMVSWCKKQTNKKNDKKKKRQVFKNTYTQSAGGPTHLTWEQIFPRPVPRSHRYRLNHCGRDIAVFETTLEVTSVMLLSTWVIRSFSTADKHTPVPGKPSWKSVLRLMSRLWSGTVRKQVQQSPSPMVTSLLSPRKKKTALQRLISAAFTCSSYVSQLPKPCMSTTFQSDLCN